MSDLPIEDDAPDLSDLDFEQYADLLTEVDDISLHATEETGH